MNGRRTLTSLAALLAAALAFLLTAVPAAAQNTEPTVPSGCGSTGGTLEPFQSLTSTATTITVTFKDPMPSGYSSSGDHAVTLCHPSSATTHKIQELPTEATSPAAGTTYTISEEVRNLDNALVHTITTETDYWVRFGDRYTNQSVWEYIRTASAGPTITIAAGTSPVTEGTAATFTVTASEAPTADLTVNLTVSEAAGSDFVAAGDEGSQTVTITATQTTATYSVTTQADTADEPDGSVTVALATGTGYSVGTTGTATVTVNDDDDVPANGVVTGLTLTPGDGTIKLDWTYTAGSNAVTGWTYRSKEGGAGFGQWTELTTDASARSGTLTGLTNDAAHTVELRASAGGTNFSNAVSAGPVTPRAGTGIKSVRIATLPRVDADGDGDADTYGVGEHIDVEVAWNGPVTRDLSAANAAMQVGLTVGANQRTAALELGGATGHTTRELRFRYTVVAADMDADGVSVEPSAAGELVVLANGATLTDAVGNAANTSRTGLAADPGRKVDGSETPAANGAPRILESNTGNTACVEATSLVLGTINSPTGTHVSLPIPTQRGSGETAEFPAACGNGTNLGRFLDDPDGDPMAYTVAWTFTDTVFATSDPTLSHVNRRVFFESRGRHETVDFPVHVTAWDPYGGSTTGNLMYKVWPPGSTVQPSFSTTVAAQEYGLNRAIADLTLPEATGGDIFRYDHDGDSATPAEPRWGYLYAVAGLPAGLAFDPETRTVSGTPTELGEFTVTYTAEDDDNDRSAADTASMQFTITVSTPNPTLTGAWVDGAALTLAYHRELDTASTPATSAFAVTVAGAARAVSAVAVDGRKVTLTLASAAAAGEAVLLDYAVPDSGPIRDTSGDDAEALSGQEVANVTGDTAAPTLLTGKFSVNAAGGSSVALYFSEALDPTHSPADDFTFSAGGTALSAAASKVKVAGRTVTMDFADFDLTAAHTMTLTTVASPALRDLAGNRLAAITSAVTLANTAASDPGAPTVSSASVNGNVLTLTFNRALDPTSLPQPGDSVFTITVGGNVSDVTVERIEQTSATTLRLVLSEAFLPSAVVSDAVALAYVKAAMDGRKLRNLWGTEVADIASQAVTNDTPLPADGLVTGLTATPGDRKIKLDWTYTAGSKTLVSWLFSVRAGDGPWGDAVNLSLDPTIRTTTLARYTDSNSMAVDMQNGTAYTVRLYMSFGGTDVVLGGTAGPVTPADQSAPVVQSAAVDGTVLTLTFDEDLDAGSVPAAAAFAVKAASGSLTSLADTAADPVTVGGRTVTLALAVAADSTETVTVSYTKPDANPIRNAAGLETADFSGQAVTNDTTNPTPPASPGALVANTAQADNTSSVSSHGDMSQQFGTGNSPAGYTLAAVDVQMRGPASTSAPLPGFAAELWSAGTKLATLTAPDALPSAIDGLARFAAPDGTGLDANTTYALLLDFTAGTDSKAGDIRVRQTDSEDEDADAAAGWSIADYVLWRQQSGTTWSQIGTPIKIAVHGARKGVPELVTAAVDWRTLTLTYGVDLDPVSDSDPDPDFTVRVAGVDDPVAVETVAVAGRAVTLTLAKAVVPGQTVTLDYDEDGDTQVKAGGVYAAGLSGHEVANMTPAPRQAVDAGSSPDCTWLSASAASGPALGAITLAWEVAAGGPAVEEWTVLWRGPAKLEYEGTNPPLAADTRAHTITELTDGTGYDVSVFAVWNSVDSCALDAFNVQALGSAGTVSAATVSGDKLVMTFSVQLDPGSVPDPGDFRVTVVGGTAQAANGVSANAAADGVIPVTGVAVDGNKVTLTLGRSVKQDETVSVAYYPGAHPLRELGGGGLTGFGDRPVSAPRPDPGGSGSGGGGGGGGTRPVDPDPENAAPETPAAIGARMLRVGTALTVDLAAHFSDPDDDPLEYAAESSDPAVVAVEVDGAALTVRAVGRGTAEITVTATDPDEESATQTFAVTVAGAERAWYLPPLADPVRQGFVRVINHSDAAGTATVTATDDAGVTYAPLTLALEARQTAPFNSRDLELGNAAKGLSGGTGPGTGGWRLAVDSDTLDVEALGYMRTADGFVTGMNAVAPRVDGALEIATFNPGSNVDQVSLLRLVNPTDAAAEATVTGVDDAGLAPGTPVRLTLGAGAACTVDAAQLEAGAGLACGVPQDGLGDGAGKWRLTVASDAPLVAMSLLASPAGHLTNLSGTAAADADGVLRVHLFPAAGDAAGRQGFVRVINRSARGGTVTVAASDDSDVDYERLTLALGAHEVAHFNSDDLELGNAAKGLTGSTGSGTGAWRLALSSDTLEFEALAYLRTTDGFLTAMQAPAPQRDGVHRVAFFNPGGNASQVSVLRVVNPGATSARVSVAGADDAGVRPGGTVRFLVPRTDAVELTAAELESGMSVERGRISSGALGDGRGKWRLRVEADQEVVVLSLLSSPTGQLTNLSRADAARGLGPLPAALLPPPETVTLESAGDHEVRGRWSAVGGAGGYAVDLLRDGVRNEYRSLARSTRTSFRWSSLSAGSYTIRACTLNEERACGPWSAESNAVAID